MQKIQKTQKINMQSGLVMLLAVIFFVSISSAVGIGLIAPVVREYRNTSDSVLSKKSYFLAESGVEDAVYRIKHNKQIDSSETITTADGEATTAITSVGSNQKQIVSLGDSYEKNRRVSTTLTTGAGVVFKYGTQGGELGVEFKNNAGLYGSLYSNGPIIGANGAFITGDVFVANAPALAADQTNDTPSTPTDSIVFGNANSTQDVAQSFQLSTTGLVNKVDLYIKKTSTPSNATVRIVTNSGSSPSTTTLASGTLNATLVTGSYGWVSVPFTANPQLLSGTTYWLVIDGATSATKYYTLGANTGYANGQAKIGAYSGTWNNTTPTGLDGYFKVYLGGINSYINNMDIGTGGTGSAHANTITNSTATGDLYCQTGNGNDQACDTSQADPTAESLPVSDANIAEWKDDALLGGVTTGDVTVSGISTLGPRKIVGNLTVSGTLTLSDTLWVTGDLIISGNAIVKLNSSYGTTSGLIIADGYISLGNNIVFQDSGTAGSYIMLLSTSTCDADTPGNPCGALDAISVNNNSDIVIANAQKGTVSFSNNASVKEVVGNKIKLQNNSTVTYGSGLINVDFTSGPSGGWMVSGWKETE